MSTGMQIDSTQFGSITINGITYPYDVYILPFGKIEKRFKKNSPRIAGHRSLGVSEIKYLFSFNPTILFIGKGQSGILPIEPQALEIIKKTSVKIVKDTTPNLIEEFNNVYSKNENIAAIFHTTC